MEYYSAIRRNTFESVLMRWMNLDPLIQGEVKEGHLTSTHIYMDSRRMVPMNLFSEQQWRCGL